MKKNILLSLVLLFILGSCTNSVNKDFLNSKISLLENKSENKIDFFNQFEYTTLESTDESIFGTVDKLIVTDNLYFILDKAEKKKVFVFTKKGKFIRTIGKIGKGPGEYTNIEDFTIDEANKKIILLCFPSKVLTYNFNGEFLSQKKLLSSGLLWNICNYKEGYWCSSNHQSVQKGNEAFLLFEFDKDFKLRKKLLNVLPKYIPMPTFASEPLLEDDGKIIYFDCFTSQIHFDVNQDEFKTLKFDLGGKEVPLEAYSNPQIFFSKQREYSFPLEYIFTDNNMLISFVNFGKRYISKVDFGAGNIKTYENYSWFPDKLFKHKDYFYSSYNPLSILENCDIVFTRKTENYPLKANSNPVILKFKEKSL